MSDELRVAVERFKDAEQKLGSFVEGIDKLQTASRSLGETRASLTVASEAVAVSAGQTTLAAQQLADVARGVAAATETLLRFDPAELRSKQEELASQLAEIKREVDLGAAQAVLWRQSIGRRLVWIAVLVGFSAVGIGMLAGLTLFGG
ncbi:MAG: hypothetical protein DWQ36_14600 [Acidobacteria bacterium]|nr:MAG: hypothetical protein DWQ30_03335 [Acidobacteriota bacterium]REK06121.1 MAG: hypothetical protein DWQ36_14600 [Acidobacteriota bacterium]